MSFYTNDIKKSTQYQQDSTNRNFSQKRLDRKFQSQLGEIEKFQADFKVTPSSIKKIKQQLPLQSNTIKQAPSHSQVIQKLLTFSLNPNKKTKSLNMLLKLFSSPQVKQIKTSQFIRCCQRLINLPIEAGNQAMNCCKIISQIFSKIYELQWQDQYQKQLITLLKEFWNIIRVLSQDDSFGFNSTLSKFLKIIQQFTIDKQQVDKYYNLVNIKVQENEIKVQQKQSQPLQQPHPSNRQQQQTQISFYIRNLILKVIKTLLNFDTNWKKLSIDQFMKTFNNQYKNKLLHTQQIKQFQQLHKIYVNKRIKNSLDKEQDSIRDQIINKNNVVNINAEVKEVNREGGSVSGNDKWISKQN